MKVTCTRRIQFCAGHRVYKHESKCANPHGHNYVALFEAEAESLDEVGRVIDFSVLKDRIGGWIDAMWDHGFIFYAGDATMRTMLMTVGAKRFSLPENPTAENMAKFLLDSVCPSVLVGTGVRVTKVILHETENCYAEASL